MRPLLPLLAALLAAASPAPPQLAAHVSESELHGSIAALVGFGTRHTASGTLAPGRGIDPALAWAEARLRAAAAVCGQCLEITRPSARFTGPRLPRETAVPILLAVQRGITDPDRVVIVSGHIDSRNSAALDATGDAPGANDDGSGTAVVLEAARVLSAHRFPATIAYAVLSGEEEGLYGGEILAREAKARNWRVEAVLNNDIVGNTRNENGKRDTTHIRLFARETEADTASRNIARFMANLAAMLPNPLTPILVLRPDRFGRGGDQLPMLKAGYPALRVTEAVENYRHQHQNIRIENGVAYGDTLDGVDFPYLARVAALNIATLAALAAAPPPPTEATSAGAVKPDSTIAWHPVSGAVRYRIHLRATAEDRWSPLADTAAPPFVARDLTIDDVWFGVSAVDAAGRESPVATALPIAK